MGLVRERGQKGLPLERVYRQLFNRDLYLMAYGIPKRTRNKKRALGLPTWSDKLLQEVIRRILDAYFEPSFSDHSHGFRPQRGCHTALKDIYQSGAGVTWYIEGDISAR